MLDFSIEQESQQPMDYYIKKKVNGILKVIESLFHSEARWQRWMNYF